MTWSWLVSLASAQQWTWPEGTTRRFVVEMETQVPYVMWLLQERNGEVRVWGAAVSLVMDCSAVRTLPKGNGWDLDCPVSDASFFAAAIMEDAGRAGPVVGEVEAMLEAAHVQFRLSPDGRVTSVDTEGLPENNQRLTFMSGQVARLVERAVIALEVPLPEPGGPPQREIKQFAIAKMPLVDMWSGSVRGTAVAAPGEGSQVNLTTEGEGSVLVFGETWSLGTRGQAVFDTAAGHLVENRALVATEGASGSISDTRLPYKLRTFASYVPPGTAVTLKPSKGF